MRAWLGPIAVLTLAPAIIFSIDRLSTPAATNTQLSVNDLLGQQLDRSFADVDGKHRFRFPEDHGPHPRFRNEWWYFTGNLESAQGPLGYELTLFRQALVSPLERLSHYSQWASRNGFMGHFALSDLGGKKFYHSERLSRESLGLAGAEISPQGKLQVWLEDWRVDGQGDEFQLQARQDEQAIQLQLRSLKPVVLQGHQGVSRKGDRPEQASYYYSLTRLETRGQVKIAGQPREVTGLSWMDREWSSRAMDDGLSGWDWLSLQLDGGEEIMVYRLRDKQGAATRWSAASWIDARGAKTWLGSDQFAMRALSFWSSPRDGTQYPASWELSIPSRQCSLRITSRLGDQELVGEVARYWEGAVSLEGSIGKRSQKGSGYMELVGYSASRR